MSKYEVIWTTFRQVLQFLVISAIIWEFLYIFYLSPTKVAKLLFYSWKRANFFRKHAKLNYMKILKSPGLRPGPIFLNFTKTSRGGGIHPPPTKIGLSQIHVPWYKTEIASWICILSYFEIILILTMRLEFRKIV